MDEQNKENRIGTIAILVLIFVSGLADAGTLIPFVGDFVSPLFWTCMTYYLYKIKHGLLNWKIFAPSIVSFVSEFIPVVQAFPTIIGATIAIIFVSRLEDKTGISLMKPLSQGQKVHLPSRTPPLNQGGIRQPRNIL
ncbi:MAG TPA: hypothetical protein VJJ28_00390 [Candidatus Paceibacterota bacterium]